MTEWQGYMRGRKEKQDLNDPQPERYPDGSGTRRMKLKDWLLNW